MVARRVLPFLARIVLFATRLLITAVLPVLVYPFRCGPDFQCLDVLASVFRNIMEHPEEAKFRKVRRSNGKFKVGAGVLSAPRLFSRVLEEIPLLRPVVK